MALMANVRLRNSTAGWDGRILLNLSSHKAPRHSKKGAAVMNPEISKPLVLTCGIFILLTWTSLLADTQHVGTAQRTAVPAAATPANIIQYVRDRFEVPEAVKVDAQPVHPSPFPRFYQTAVTVDDGKQKRVSDVFITTDALCFVLGNIFALNGASNTEVIRCVREAAKLSARGPSYGWSFRQYPVSGFPEINGNGAGRNQGAER